MGVMARDQGEVFVVTSDRILRRGEEHASGKKDVQHLSGCGQAIAGRSVKTDAKTFQTVDAARR